MKIHSCFITDIDLSDKKYAVLTDSTKCRWHVDLADKQIFSSFQTWLNLVFLKGVAQTLTVFKYRATDDELDVEYWITEFYTNKKTEMLNESEVSSPKCMI